MLPDKEMLRVGLKQVCPRCKTEPLFDSVFDFQGKKTCTNCGLDISKNDSADGPAVFILFILCFALTPLALAFEAMVEPPLWVHAVLWGGLAIGLTVATIKPLRAYTIALEYKHRPWD